VKRPALGAIALLALGACATDRVTLLPNEDGKAVGALAVLEPDGGETVIDRPNTQAGLRSGSTSIRPVDGLDSSFAALFGTLPPAAKAFAITFPTGESRIFEGQRKILDEIRAELARRPGAQIEVAGFTDSAGDASANDLLSIQRAQSVAGELREFGFPIAPEDAVGRGEDDARAELGDNVPSERYRRVFVIVR
jgi:outer membrane protein OmpA-like peptidoglycan-associated protein